MNLRYITASDARSNLLPHDVLEFLTMSRKIELGVQAHDTAMSFGFERWQWFNTLAHAAQHANVPLNLALHINYSWCDMFCDGSVPQEILEFMSLRNVYTHKPVVGRIQLNIGDGTKPVNPYKLQATMEHFPGVEFILPYNLRTLHTVNKLMYNGARFSVLYDASYGAGVLPKQWDAPVCTWVPTGYAGGLTPENVTTQLDKINAVVPNGYETWIDAEGGLRDNTTTGVFTLARAREYVQNALKWETQHQK